MIIVPNDCPSSSSSKADKWATNLKAGMPLSTVSTLGMFRYLMVFEHMSPERKARSAALVS